MFMIMTLDITRVQKVDKCPMIMTSQISCQGQGSSSVISVSSSLPLGTCPQSQFGLGGNFSMDAGFGNQTSVDDSEQKRPRLRLAWTDSWYLLENNDSSPHSRFFQRSVKNTNTVNQCIWKQWNKDKNSVETNVFESSNRKSLKNVNTIMFGMKSL